MTLKFDFGQNWKDFSISKMNSQRFHSAEKSLLKWFGTENLKGKTFLDIGCGSGIFSIAAAKCGAKEIVGFDINPKAIDISKRNLASFVSDNHISKKIRFTVGSILDKTFLEEIGTFDIVYAWGSLHHTSSMYQAITNAASLVEPEKGSFMLAIYNSHLTSLFWTFIKKIYNLSPKPVRTIFNYFFGALFYAAVLITTRSNPLNKERGMDFWHDVIDWLGGYPYEYATVSEIINFVQPLGFQLQKVVRPRVPIGCNEFLFKRGFPS